MLIENKAEYFLLISDELYYKKYHFLLINDKLYYKKIPFLTEKIFHRIKMKFKFKK